jgi:hypothetical protein
MQFFFSRCPNGLIDGIVVNKEAYAAIAFVAQESIVDIHALPGHLLEEEKLLIAEILEETGLFTRMVL